MRIFGARIFLSLLAGKFSLVCTAFPLIKISTEKIAEGFTLIFSQSEF